MKKQFLLILKTSIKKKEKKQKKTQLNNQIPHSSSI